MARPESISDIEVSHRTAFATFETDKFNTDGVMLRLYAEFMEKIQKVGGDVEAGYNRVTFYRPASHQEKLDELKSAQSDWDTRKAYYEAMKDFGSIEDWKIDMTRRWAEAEGLPFPPEHTPIESFDATIRDIDELIET